MLVALPALALIASTARRAGSGAAARARACLVVVLVLPWFSAIFCAQRQRFSSTRWQGHLAKVVERAGIARRAARLLSRAVLGDVLAGRAARRLAAPAVWAAGGRRGPRFLLAWIMPAWIVFELVITKLPHYVLPLYPAIAILIAGGSTPSAVAQPLARPRHLVVVRCAARGRHRGIIIGIYVGGQSICCPGHLRPRRYFRLSRLVALRSRRPRAVAVARGGGVHPDRGRPLRRDLPFDDRLFPSVDAGGNTREAGLRRSGCGLRRLSGAEPGLSRRHADASRRRRRAPRISCGRAAAGLPSSIRATSAASRAAPKRSGCAMRKARASTASISAAAAPSPSRSTARKLRNDRAAADWSKSWRLGCVHWCSPRGIRRGAEGRYGR